MGFPQLVRNSASTTIPKANTNHIKNQLNCFSGIFGQIPDNLQYAYTNLISKADCQAVWGSQVTDRMQCANDNSNSACNVSNWF